MKSLEKIAKIERNISVVPDGVPGEIMKTVGKP